MGITKHDWLQALLFGLSVAVGLTPEMLPMIVTVCLSKGAVFMSRKKVIVKKLKAIQNLGAMDILCTDKTGTITQDKVVLERHVDVTNRPSEDVLRYAWMNSYYQTGLRNLLDNSILSNEDLDVERSCRKVDEIPFDFVRKRMSVIIEYEGDHVLICKGSVEAVFEACDRYQIDDEILPLIDMLRQDILEEYESLSKQGFRVLAIAYREYPKDREVFSAADESGLILLGYLAFFDPPKDSAEKAIRTLGEHGVRVKVLTGDNELVTKKVCDDVGFAAQKVVTGKELEGLDEAAFAAAVAEHDVFARLTPTHKERIVALPAGPGPRRRLHGRRDQRRGRDARGRRRHLRGHGRRRGQGIGRHHPPREEPPRARGRHHRGAAPLQQHPQVHPDGRELQLRQHVLRGRQRLPPALPPHGSRADTPQQPPLRRLADGHSPRQRRRRGGRGAAEVGRLHDKEVHGPHRADLLDLRLRHLRPHVVVLRLLGLARARDRAATKAHLEQLFHTGWFVESLLTQTLIVHIIRTNRIPFIQSRASLAMTFTTARRDGDRASPCPTRPSRPSSASCRCRAPSGPG